MSLGRGRVGGEAALAAVAGLVDLSAELGGRATSSLRTATSATLSGLTKRRSDHRLFFSGATSPFTITGSEKRLRLFMREERSSGSELYRKNAAYVPAIAAETRGESKIPRMRGDF